MTTLASESLALQTTLERSLARVLVAMRSSVGTVHLLDETEETLHLAAHQGIPAAAVAQTDFSTPPPHLTDWVMQHGEPLVIPDLAADPKAPQATPMTNSRAYAGVPMQARRRVLGVLSVVRETGRQFNVEEMALLAPSPTRWRWRWKTSGCTSRQSDQVAFTNAFERWFGMPPGRWRATFGQGRPKRAPSRATRPPQVS